ncbi:MAG TPA: cation:proton antiporter [Enhygromyxa sp.]|nr:cation:proton antiporter [Enhygromyxa sp.]
MKRIVVVLALLAMMVGLRLLEVEDLGGADPLTLAAIGFVILASFALAELLARVGLPKVTGYILSGLVLGPHAGGILSEAVVEQMGMFNTLALGLIALTAGLELEYRALGRLARTLLATTGAKVLIAAPAVGLAFLGVELFFHPLGLSTDAEVIGLALVFAALSVGTSPSISLAILSETGAKGRLSELVLGAAVFKDLVVVVLLAIAIAATQSLVGGGGDAGSVMLHVAGHLALEIVAGGVVGLLLIAYLRWIKAEMLLFVAALVLVVAEVAHSFELEPLLVFITAGFVVRNFSEFEHDLHPPLALVSLPVFVVFFTVRAASLDLGATLEILPLALLLFTVRAVGFYVSAKIGNRIGGEQPKVADNAWFSYLPQAGVTLGLVGVAAHSLSMFEAHINTLGTAVVALNLFVGPVALRTGLRRAGELPGEPGQDEIAVGEQADSGERALALEPLSPELEARLATLRQLIATELDAGVRARIGPWIALRRRAFANLDPESIAEITALAESPPRSDAAALANSLAALFEAAANHPQHLEVSSRVPLEPRWLEIDERAPPLRRLRTRARRIAAKLGSRATRRIGTWRVLAALADTLRRRLAGTLDPADVRETLALQLAELEARAAAIVAGVLDAGSQRMRMLLARIDSPEMSVRQLDFGEAATGIERELGTLLSEAQHWPMVIDACWQTVEVSARIRRLDDRLAASRDSADDLLAAKLAVEEELGAFARRLRTIRDELDGKKDALDEQQLDAISTRALGLLPKPASKRLRQIEQRLRRASDSKAIQQALREAAARDTGAKVLVGPELVVVATIPAAIRTHEVDVRELIDGEIAGRLLPATERELENAARLVSDAQTAAAAMVGDVELLTEVYRRQDSKEATLDNLRAGLERVQARCEELLGETVDALGRAAVTIAAEFDGLGDRLSTALHDATGEGETARWVSRRTDRAKRQVGRELARLRERALELWATLRERARELTAALTNDYRLRSGRDLPTAAAIAKLVELDAAPRISREYANLFADQPIRDPRFFVANREVLRTIGKAERHWQQHRTANALLVVGGPGSGKTSLLNVAALKLATRETLWLPEQRDGFLVSLAAELHCAAQLDAVVRRLLDRPRVIVIDDLERRLPLDHRAIDELELLARLIARTAASSFWLVATQRELQQLLARHWPLRVGFAERVVLGRLDGEELAAAILARHRISHLELAFPLSPAQRLLARALGREPGGQQRRFFTALARESGGNLRAALTEWCRAGTIQEQTLMLEPLARTRALPFLRQLPSTALALLALVLRFGPSEREQLAAALRRESDELDRWLHFLLTAELLTQDEHGAYACPARVRDVLTPELVELAVFHQEDA